MAAAHRVRKRRFLAVARNDNTDRPLGQLGKYLS